MDMNFSVGDILSPTEKLRIRFFHPCKNPILCYNLLCDIFPGKCHTVTYTMRGQELHLPMQLAFAVYMKGTDLYDRNYI